MGAFLGAEVTGIDLTRPLDDATVKAIGDGLAVHEVLVFPRQAISSEDLKRFGRYFGELTVHPFSTNAADSPELIVYDNKEGNPPAATDIWHSDETFRECPPMGTMLFEDRPADRRRYRLSQHDGRLREPLRSPAALHLGPGGGARFQAVQGAVCRDRGRLAKAAAFRGDLPPRHASGRAGASGVGKKVLFVNPQFTLFIKGMEERESRALLDTLLRVTTVLEHQYRHRWEPNMVVFWDNRSTQHAAVHDYYPQRRLMERVTISGDRPHGTGEAAKVSELRKFKMPPLMSLKERARRQHERIQPARRSSCAPAKQSDAPIAT